MGTEFNSRAYATMIRKHCTDRLRNMKDHLGDSPDDERRKLVIAEELSRRGK